MMSPEGYYVVYLKGKTQEEVLKKIRSLKRENNHLRRCLEDDSVELVKTFPSKLTRLKYNRMYLNRAIQAFIEAGGKYTPTKAEQKSREFNDALETLERLVFTFGSFFNGYETRIYTVTGDKVMLDVNHTLLLKPSNLPVYYPFTKKEFISGLKELHVDEWKRSYDNLDVMDGTQWELEIRFYNGRKPKKFYGSNAYPYNFHDLTRFLEIYWEEVVNEQD